MYLSWDEWQVWYKGDPVQGNWTEAPHLAEEIYNLEDALVVAQWLNVFLRKSQVIKIACVAQIVNVIAPIQTRGDDMLLQTVTGVLTTLLASVAAISLFIATRMVESRRWR